ncbi:MAG: hypothetical protein ACUVXJ_12435 [Phycisphaerae bacterium]
MAPESGGIWRFLCRKAEGVEHQEAVIDVIVKLYCIIWRIMTACRSCLSQRAVSTKL